METVCLFNKMDSFPLSNGHLTAAGLAGFLHSHDSERPLRDKPTLKRRSGWKINDSSGVLSSSKQLRMDNAQDYLCNSEGSTLDLKLNVLSSIGDNSLCELRIEKNHSPIDQLRKLDLKELCLKQILQTSVMHKTNLDLNNMLEQSRQKLYKSIDDNFDNIVDNSKNKKLLDDIDIDDIHEKRCRSLPNSLLLPTNTIPCTSPEKNFSVEEISRLMFPLSTTKTSIHNLHSENFHKVDDMCDNNVNCSEDERDDLESCSSTQSSGFIDIEAETPHSSPPSSPLNLSTHNESIAIHDTLSKTATIPHSPACAQSIHGAPEATSQEDRNICEENVKQNVQSIEKKISFSIDAILRPDFGSSNCVSNDVSHSPSRLQTSCPASPSAFTAVDLRIKSRSESLSSPCSSSSSRSSPSSPLSSSPLALRRNWDNGHDLYTEQYTRNADNFLSPKRLFPKSNKDMEMFIGGQFPFISPSIHGVSKVPFSRTFPPSSHVTSAPFIDDFTHPRNFSFVPNVINPKGERTLQKDISKLINWSVQNHLTNSSKSQIISVQQSLIPSEPMSSNPVLKRLYSNQNTQLSKDAKVRTKGDPINTKATDRQSQKTLPFQTCANIQGKEEKRDLKEDTKINRVSDKTVAQDKGENPLWPAWVFCTRYSDRPSSGPRSRKQKRNKAQDEKRPRTAFTNDQLQRLKREFEDCRYLTETRRKNLADELGLTESQIKIWFQNKRAKIKKSVGVRNPLALQLMEQGLYNHSTVKDLMNQDFGTETTSDAGEESS